MSLELDRGIVSNSEFPSFETELENGNGSGRIFASQVGVSVIAESLNQMALARSVICAFISMKTYLTNLTINNLTNN
jgi:hypothetical protein